MVLACARELMYGVPVCRRIIIWEACAVTLEDVDLCDVAFYGRRHVLPGTMKRRVLSPKTLYFLGYVDPMFRLSLLCSVGRVIVSFFRS